MYSLIYFFTYLSYKYIDDSRYIARYSTHNWTSNQGREHSLLLCNYSAGSWPKL